MPQTEEYLIEKEEEQASLGDRLQQLAVRYVGWWPLFAVLLLVGITGAWLYLRYTTPMYQAQATILLKDDKNGNSQSQILQSLNLFDDSKNVENEMQVIKSRTLAMEVAKKLRLYAPVMHKGSVRDVSIYTGSPVIIEAADPDSLETVDEIPFRYDSVKAAVMIDGRLYPIGDTSVTPYGKLAFLPNAQLKGKPTETGNLYFSLMPLEDAGLLLLNRLDISPVSKQATVITFTYTDAVPQRGKDILNTWIAVYNQAAIEDKNQLASNTLKFVDDRLKYVVNELDSVEHGLQNYRTKNRITDLSEQGKLFLDNMGATDQKITEMNMQLAVLDKVESYVMGKAGLDNAIAPATLGITDPVLLQSLQALYDLQAKRMQLEKVTGINYPGVTTVVEQIAKTKPLVLENIRNQHQNLQAGITNLERTNGKYAGVLNTMPQKERELFNISRQQAIKNNIFTFLLQKREETALSYSSTVADTRLIDKASANKIPVSPKKKIVVLGFILAALFLGILIVEIKEMTNRTVKSREEVEKQTQIPIVGELVQEKLGDNAIVIGQGRRSLAAEQFRQLRTSLGYLGLNSRKKRVLVTSSISGEGKSFITANLGISLALTGKKVVLLELDLRKPKLSAIFNMPRQQGITQYLISEKEAEDVIKTVPDQPGLFIIPCGPLPPNPSELIMNGRLSELLAYLDQHFDYILIDTCPVSPVTDAYIISPMCDATLYVIRQGVTPKYFLKKLDEHLKIKSLKNTAIVCNGIKAAGSGKYGYGYGYGYGYFEEAKSPKLNYRN
jgi:tyrosine-protein kinase Etk/Wzc